MDNNERLLFLYEFKQTDDFRAASMLDKLEIMDEIQKLELELNLKEKPDFQQINCEGCGS